MKITRIQADNFLGLKSIDVKPATVVTLFAGRNGSGKSSIQEAVRMAFTQDHVRDIEKKKEFGALVHAGEKAGGAQIMVDNDLDKTFAFNMPKGDFAGPEISESMRVALYGQRFARMTADERRTFLFNLTKCKRDAATVKVRMLAKECQEAKIDAVLPLLRTGFPSVCDHAKSKATEAKGAWRQLTGETYGPVKADSWEAPLPDLPPGDAAALAERIEGLDKNIAQMNESLGAIKNTARAAAENVAKRRALEESAGKVAGLESQLERAKEELAEYEPKVVALRARAAGTARTGLVHDMAGWMAETLPSLASSVAAHGAKNLLERYEEEHGPLTAGKPDPDAVASLPQHESGLVVMQNRAKNLQRDLDSAKMAKGQYDALAPAAEAVDATAEIAEVEQLIAKVKTDRAAAAAILQEINAAELARTQAGTKTKEAKKHHEDVTEWTKVADALAPDGIPAEILADALAPVNAALEQAAIDTDWMTAKIGPDMALTANGRPYQLLSESEQWRVDAMIAQVVSELSGLRVLMLDRVDVLDLPGRAQLLEWMDALAYNNVVDSVLLFGTFKALPEGLADTISAYWVENGMIAGAREQAAA